ncbi:MAG: hypothetical protein CVV18_07395 [Gammaproteobacteria bacterium HGW-Gammaproteobacteria-8]|nr:MAG: hypothetical protein CVV18_07395 [Gammaproteobacteria bacterium HGW-Gammaproteobacteria-8]
MRILTILVFAVSAAAIYWLVSRPAVPKSYVESYREALRTQPGSELAIDLGVERFRQAFSDLSSTATRDRFLALYAERMYFHDTLKHFERREMLADYMGAMAKTIEASEVEIDQVIRDRADVYLRWTMRFEIRAVGRPLMSDTIGMTHVRFNEQGEVVLHQDFWDPASGLYRQLPVIGWVLDRVDRRLDQG